jgi:DMSO/TMAO reductase YedYZ molybdopterin-dependent catalytic subunit
VKPQPHSATTLKKWRGEESPSVLRRRGCQTTNLTLEEFLHEDNFFAFQLFGQPLPPDHGGPLRLVVPHLYAWKSSKWINGLEFLDREQLGFWELNGYHRRGDPWLEERYGSF